MRTIYLGKLGGLTLSAKPNTVVGLLVIWGLLSLTGIALLQLSTAQAVMGGLLAALLHFASEMIHQYGHAAAARRTGHPMKGMRFWWVLAQSIYRQMKETYRREYTYNEHSEGQPPA